MYIFLGKKSYQLFILIIVIFSLLWKCSPTETENEPDDITWTPVTEDVNGNLQDINGIQVMKLWGTAYEQGYAHGYLKAPDFVAFIDEYLADPIARFNRNDWETGLEMLDIFEYPAAYEDELQGILDGMEARAGGEVPIQAFQRVLTINDLRGLQSDLDKIQCSSFSAWGAMTSDGGTITGRNMDYDPIAVMMESQMIIVRIPSAISEKLAWVAISWPGEIGCTTGMNEEGVTVSQQDVYRYPPTATDRFTPDNLVHRLIIESAHAATVVQNIENILQSHYVATGCAPMISWPYTGDSTASVVPEFDGKVSITNGYSIRQPQEGQAFQIVANHFRERIPPMQDCWRYNLIENRLLQISASAGVEHVTTNVAWDLLANTPIAETVSMHSVVFEPNKMLMHVAFSENGQHAPNCTKVTFDIGDLLTP
ncbi:C45 family autoproteolytic acyltransferase/hydrolase [Calditrichota bacterium]